MQDDWIMVLVRLREADESGTMKDFVYFKRFTWPQLPQNGQKFMLNGEGAAGVVENTFFAYDGTAYVTVGPSSPGASITSEMLVKGGWELSR